MTETIQLAGAQRAGATCIDREDDIEMLIFGEIAADQSIAARGRLPVDDVLRIAGAIVAQLQNLAAGAQKRPRAHT